MKIKSQPFGKIQIWRLSEIENLKYRKAGFVTRGWLKRISRLIFPKESKVKISNFMQKSWANPFEKIQSWRRSKIDIFIV